MNEKDASDTATDRVVQELMNQLRPLLGKWKGNGEGAFPTIDSFTYDEETEFISNGVDPLIHYEQKTWDTTHSHTPPEPLHWESGFIRPTEDGFVEISNAQNGGRVEVLRGRLTPPGESASAPFLSLASVMIGNDDRLITTGRRYFLRNGILSYEMEMATRTTTSPTTHLRATLRQVT